jgi:hypothetical protein
LQIRQKGGLKKLAIAFLVKSDRSQGELEFNVVGVGWWVRSLFDQARVQPFDTGLAKTVSDRIFSLGRLPQIFQWIDSTLDENAVFEMHRENLKTIEFKPTTLQQLTLLCQLSRRPNIREIFPECWSGNNSGGFGVGKVIHYAIAIAHLTLRH